MRTQMKDGAGDQKSRVKVGKLQVNKETVEDLTDKEAEQIKGGGFLSVDPVTCPDKLHTIVCQQPPTANQSDCFGGVTKGCPYP